MFTIGEFSRITGFSIKALRLYHEKGLLVPYTVDAESGYRYYNKQNIERARVLKILLRFEFPLAEIKELLDDFSEDADIVDELEKRCQALQDKLRHYRKTVRMLEALTDQIKEARIMKDEPSEGVVEKVIPELLVAGIRYKGKYSDCGKYFGKIFRKLGRYCSGKPFNLYYDGEYKEEDADIESCVPVREAKEIPGITIRTLPGGKCISLIHKGPYEELGRSYEQIFTFIKEENYQSVIPSREIYIKGPGMIFRGNPKKYITEIQVMIAGS